MCEEKKETVLPSPIAGHEALAIAAEILEKYRAAFLELAK